MNLMYKYDNPESILSHCVKLSYFHHLKNGEGKCRMSQLLVSKPHAYDAYL